MEIASPHSIIDQQLKLLKQASDIGHLDEKQIRSLEILIKCWLLLQDIQSQPTQDYDQFSVDDLKKLLNSNG
jgi:hypothetical protein